MDYVGDADAVLALDAQTRPLPAHVSAAFDRASLPATYLRNDPESKMNSDEYYIMW